MGSGGCVQRIEVIVKRKKKSGGGHSRCKWGSEAFVKFKKKKNSRGGGGGVRLGEGWCQSGCERRSDAFLKIIFFCWGGGGVGLGVRVEVIGEVKFLWKFEKKNYFFFLGGGGSGRGVRSGVGEGVEVARFGVGG